MYYSFPSESITMIDLTINRFCFDVPTIGIQKLKDEKKMSFIQKCVFWTFDFQYSENRHVLEVNQPKMSMSMNQLWEKKSFLWLRLRLKSPQQMGSPGWNHHHKNSCFNLLLLRVMNFFLLLGIGLGLGVFFFFIISSNVCSDVAWLISTRQWSSKKMTTWIFPSCLSVNLSAVAIWMNG